MRCSGSGISLLRTFQSFIARLLVLTSVGTPILPAVQEVACTISWIHVLQRMWHRHSEILQRQLGCRISEGELCTTHARRDPRAKLLDPETHARNGSLIQLQPSFPESSKHSSGNPAVDVCAASRSRTSQLFAQDEPSLCPVSASQA